MTRGSGILSAFMTAYRVVEQFFRRSRSAPADYDRQLAIIVGAVTHLHRKLDQLMAKVDTLAGVLASINTTTNDIATAIDQVIADDAAEDKAFQDEIDRLKAEIAAGNPVTDAQLDALIASGTDTASKLAAISDVLKATAADPANPAPVLPPSTGGGEV